MAKSFSISEKRLKKVSTTFFCAVVYFSVVYWLRHTWFSPDSTNYMAAGMNLLARGEFSVFINWPSFSMEPTMEVYRVQPFGFPVYLSFFLFIFRDPYISAVIAQTIAILILFWGIWKCMELGNWKPRTRITFLVLFLSFGSFANILSFLWTEPLFIGLSLMTLLKSHQAFFKENRKTDQVWLALLLFSSAALRFTGIFNLGFLLPALFRKRLRISFFAILSVVSFLPALIWKFRSRILDGRDFESHYAWSASFEEISKKTLNILSSLEYALAYQSSVVGALLLIGLGWLLWRQIRHREQIKNGGEEIFLCEIASGFVSHFFGLSALAVLSEIGNLIRPDLEQARLLALSYLLFFVLVHQCLNSLSGKRIVVSTVLILALVGNYPAFSFRSRAHFLPRIYEPVERGLWKEMVALEVVRRAKFFYTDYDFVHQLFSGKIQRVLWRHEQGFISNSDVLEFRNLLQKEGDPFFLVRSQSVGLVSSLRKLSKEAGLLEMTFPKYGYHLFYSEDPRR